MKKTLLAITTFNQAKYTEKCFESLKDSPSKIICIDDASTDRTRKVCDHWGVEFIGRQKSQGLTYSWNVAYQYFLKHDFDQLIISNNDVLFPRGSLEALSETLEKHPYVGVMTRRNEIGFWADQFGVETYYDIDSNKVDNPCRYQEIQNFISVNPLPPREVDIIYGFCFGVNRNIQRYEYAPHLLFNPRNINIGQEEDLAQRVPCKVLCRAAFVYHYKGLSFGGHNRLVDFRGRDIRNKLKIFHHPLYQLFLPFKNALALKKKSSRPTIVIVVGMYRSGTSAVSGILHYAGLSMGETETFIPNALHENPKGFFENFNFRALNDEIIERYTHPVKSWIFEKKTKISPSRKVRLKMRKLLSKQNGESLRWGWKDPRSCLTLAHWLEALQELDLGRYTKIVHVYRDPRAVACSLMALQNTTYEDGLNFWHLYNTEALNASSTWHFKTFYLQYEDLIENPEENIKHLFEYLGLPKQTKKAVDFLDASLNHHAPLKEEISALPEEVQNVLNELNRLKKAQPH